MADKKADLAGPELATTQELEHVLPADYSSLLSPKETQRAIFEVKNYIEENLCKELNLMMVTVPLIVDEETGVNDYLDRDGSRTPIQFHISNDRDKHPITAQVRAGRDQVEEDGAEAIQPATRPRLVHRHGAPSARTTSSTTTTAPTSISGTGSA